MNYELFLGSKLFVEQIRKEFLPVEPEAAITQQAQLAKYYDPMRILHKVERILKCDVKRYLHAGRVSGAEKETRDLMIYLIWEAGVLANDQIGQLFGVSFSAVSHAVKSLKARMQEDPKLQAKFGQLYSQFKL